MFMILRKKTILFTILFFALCLTICLSAVYSGDESVSTDSTETQYEPMGKSELVSGENVEPDQYTSALQKKKQSREEAIKLLNETVNNVSASADARNEASEKINTIAENMLKESAIEDLLKAKGYEKSIIYISDKEINANIFTDNLSDGDIVKIKDIIMSQTDNNNIKIVAVRQKL